ncbi:MAG: hypothetical protein HKN17_06190, partial [Rhodothermales bacterium]|nr:hypothetical protein [Rhodothermales bacterium]
DTAQTAADSTDVDGEAADSTVDGEAADSTVDDGPTWILGRYDDVPPAPERVVSSGRRHLEVRFSEPVSMIPGQLSNLSVSGPVADTLATTVYSTGPGLRRTVGVHVDALSPGTWTLTGQFPVADSVGNTASPGEIVFDIPDGPDDDAPRVASFLPDSSAGTAVGVDRRVTIWPGDSGGVRFDIPVPGAVQDGLLTARDTSGLDLTNRLRYAAPNLWVFDDSLLGVPFELTATSADSSLAVRYERAGASGTGELSGVVDVRPPAPAGARVVIEAYRSGVSSTSPIRSVTVSGGPFVIRGLPGGLRVTLRAFLDTNGNGTWDAGLPVPFTAPEPVTWLNAPEPVRARWETSLSDTLTIDLHE